MHIDICVPYRDSERTPLFAEDEESIDYHTPNETADRTTAAFAATELSSHLRRTLIDSTFTFRSSGARVDRGADDLRIDLSIEPDGRPDGSYRLEGVDGGVRITGSDRVGLLYGVYELLRLQGWEWTEPGAEGESVPVPRKTLVLPESPLLREPSFTLCRGFDASFASMESNDFLLWMARHRLNLTGYRPQTGAFGRKLGMRYKNGGHIFEDILDPERTTDSGESFWDAHREWYGLPASGERTLEGALRTQFCVSRPDLLAFLGEELVRTIESKWSQADFVSVWGFDTWGSCCTCPDCRKLGNDTDQYLHLLSSLRSAIDDSVAAGRLRRGIRMSGCAYEGTSTLGGPEGAIPENLIAAGDAIIYYPIDRSYAADLFDEREPMNRPYARALESWLERSDRLPIIVGEYYNVSKFEDLPALFSKRIAADLSEYEGRGVSGMTWMHVPMVNWALRAQTQGLYAEYCYRGKAADRSWNDRYLSARYGRHATSMRSVYESVESAWSRIAEWRAWHGSLLSRLLHWDGEKPAAALALPNEFSSAGVAVADGLRATALLASAFETVKSLLRDEREGDERADGDGGRAVNPVEAGRRKSLLPYERSLGEDLRALRYGVDTMEAMTALVACHDSMFRGDECATETAWTTVEACVERLDSYWVPIGYEYPGPGLRSLDALSRSQLKEIVNRLRLARRRSRQ